MSKHVHSFLALGDSYTIGESVPLHENFPYQTVQLLRKSDHAFHAPEIIAKTGWTTFELAEQLLHTTLLPHYDFVTLLIGVNNQYRGLPADEYSTDLEFLVKKAIHLAADKPAHVHLLSIPDWGITPFAKDRDSRKIAKEIDAFNHIAMQMARQYGTGWLDITGSTREATNDAALLAGDGLHPSGKEYGRWAQWLAKKIEATL